MADSTTPSRPQSGPPMVTETSPVPKPEKKKKAKKTSRKNQGKPR